MTLRKLSQTLVCAAGLAVLCGSSLPADEPAQDAVKPPQSNPPVAADPTSAIQAGDPVFDSAVINSLNLVAATYGNPLGVEVGDVDAALRTQLGIEDGVGVVVTGVNKDSEAAKAGLELYDLVLQIGDQKIAGTKPFHDLVGSQQEKTVEFRIVHKGKPATVAVTIPKRLLYTIVDPNVAARHTARLFLGVRTDGQRHLKTHDAVRYLASTAADRGPQVEQHYRIGVNLAEADNTLRSQLRLAAGEGLVVTDVLDDSAAAKAGIQKNDVWIKLDGKRLTSVEAVNTQVQEIKDRKVTVTLYRGGNEISVEVTPRLVSEPVHRELMLRDMSEWLRASEYERAYRAALDGRRLAHVEWATRPAAAEQLAAVKKQLAELQKAVETLEAALAAPAAKPETPEEKK